MPRIYKCKCCGKNYTFWNGVGFAFPSVFLKLANKAKAGEYGTELQNLMAEHPEGTIDASIAIYYCRKCGAWETDDCLDFYLPKSIEKASEPGIWSVSMPTGGLTEEAYDGLKLVLPWQLKKDYRLFKKHPHKCKACGTTMTKYAAPPIDRNSEDKDETKLKCLQCGGIIAKTDDILCID